MMRRSGLSRPAGGVRRSHPALHHARVSHDNLIGWWSWTSYYMAINEGVVADQRPVAGGTSEVARLPVLPHRRRLPVRPRRIHHAQRRAFPHGMRPLGDEVRRLGLTFGIWTAPFEVSIAPGFTRTTRTGWCTPPTASRSNWQSSGMATRSTRWTRRIPARRNICARPTAR